MYSVKLKAGILRRTKSTSDLGVVNSFDSKCVKCDSSCSHKDSVKIDALLVSLEKARKQILSLKESKQKLMGILMDHLRWEVKIIKDDAQISNVNMMNTIASFVEESMKALDELDFEDIDDLEEPNPQAKCLLAAIETKTLKIDADAKDVIKNLTKKHEQLEHVSDVKGSTLLLKRMMKVPKLDVSKRVSDDEKFSRVWWKYFSENNDTKIPLRDTMKAQSKIESGFDSKVKKSALSPDLLPKFILPPLLLDTDLYAEEQKVPPSPPQPADPEVSIIDHLMQSAIINKKLSEGDFNGSFEEALSLCNLALLMGLCRAADPAAVFSPCRLSQAVLLSLVQQLATDMVHETQLKCRYLEEAMINLDVENQVTQKHLPVVVEEVRKHLSKFVRAYPHHVANRRISLIIMAADNLIK